MGHPDHEDDVDEEVEECEFFQDVEDEEQEHIVFLACLSEHFFQSLVKISLDDAYLVDILHDSK